MKSSNNFAATVLASVHQSLAEIGFHERKQGIPCRIVSDDVLALVGLNTARSGRGPGVLEINTVVGIRNQRVEKLVSELDEFPYNEVSPFTAGANVGYLSPVDRYTPFLFREAEPIDVISAELAAAVRDYGLPFVEANIDLATLLTTLRSPRRSIQFQSAYRIPVVLHLLERDEEALAHLDGQLAKLDSPKRSDPAAEQFRRFAARFREIAQTRQNVAGP